MISHKNFLTRSDINIFYLIKLTRTLKYRINYVGESGSVDLLSMWVRIYSELHITAGG